MTKIPSQAKDVLTPFRYADLPSELKSMVCRELFPSVRFELETRNCSCCEYVESLVITSFRDPPGNLRANKELRSACMPLFLASLVPVTFDIFPNDALARVPARYFEKVTTMVVDEETAQLPDPTLLPSVQELIIHICWDYDVTDKVLTADRDDDLEEILEKIMDAYSKTNICYFIEDYKIKGKVLPFRVLVETQVDLTCKFDHCEVLWLEGILVDIAARKIIKHDKANEIGHESGCPANSNDNESGSEEIEDDDEKPIENAASKAEATPAVD